MIIRASRILQLLIAAAVLAGIIFVELVTYGPDIDGRTPSRIDTIQILSIESTIFLAFALSAIGLFRWHRLGWWSSFVLDGLLCLIAGFMIVGDLSSRYLTTKEGQNALHGDLAIHSAIFLLCAGASILLLLTRKQFPADKAY